MTDGMFFEQGYWTANQSVRRRLFFMGSALLWLAIPIADLSNQDPSGLEIAGAAVGMVAFAIVFLDAAWRPVTHEDIARVLVRTGLALALATTLTLTLVPSFALMFVLAAVGAGIRLPPRLGVPAVLFTTVLAAVSSALGGATGAQVGSWAVTTVAMGILFVAFGRLIVANMELRAARAELAQRAVAEERERFSRDLHDLLGHSLSVIALKAELADRTLPDHPERAEREVRQIQTVAREALAEVRQTVSGYRLPTLEGELAGARMALEAAGIEADLASERIALPPEAEAALAGPCVRARRTSSATAMRATRRSGSCPVSWPRAPRSSTTAAAPTAARPTAATAWPGCASGPSASAARSTPAPAPPAASACALASRCDPRPPRRGPDDGPRGDRQPARARVRRRGRGAGRARGRRCASRPAGRRAARHRDAGRLGPRRRGGAARRAARDARPHPHHVRPARVPAPRDGERRRRVPAQGRARAELARAIRRAMAGDKVVDPGLAAEALSEGESPLTPREREVLDRARRDGTIAEIAASLHLSPGTTRNHLSSIMGKLGAQSRIEAIRIAEAKGWL